MEVSGDEMKTYAMDHHGLVAAVCKDSAHIPLRSFSYNFELILSSSG